MKIRLHMALLFGLSSTLSSCALSTPFKATHKAPHTTVKILPLGDSITGASTQKLSYRYPLWKQLIDAGKHVEFIGSQSQKGNGYRTWASYKGHTFPQRNEAHSGWRTDQVLNGLETGEVGLDHWIKDYSPDIALIHLGTNDIHQAQSPESTRDEVEQVISKLRQKNPQIKIALARIIPMSTNHNIPRFNQLIAQLAQKLNRPRSPVVSVDMFSGFNIQNNMQIDQIHPNASGEEIMAKRWFQILMRKEFLGKQ